MSELSTPAAQQAIQAILAPALMISASGLILLGLNNRFGAVVNRIRTLNDEKRRSLVDPEAIDREYVDTLRFESVMRQLPSLITRANYLRTSLFSLWVGVMFYLISSLLLGINFFFTARSATEAVWVFLIGLAAASVGVVFAMMELVLAQKVLRLETEIY